MIIRLIGETDIVDIDPADHDGGAHPKLMGLDVHDRVNLLGHWLDQDRGASLQDDPDFRSAMTAIGSQLAAGQSGDGVNFTVITILREKWPVGSKARFQAKADRVGAAHTYIVHRCDAASLDDLDDEAAVKQSETMQLTMSVLHFRRMRKQYANSSAVQTLIRQHS
ncbi:MAG: hypothetical protein CMM73_03700 [Rhodospirillaceae bacterium]|nr:hypothetical protein [Rhodospirillaceae bacterium]